MTIPDKLLSIQDCEEAQKRIDFYPAERAVYKQLADVMRQNELLQRTLEYIAIGENTTIDALVKQYQYYRDKHSLPDQKHQAFDVTKKLAKQPKNFDYMETRGILAECQSCKATPCECVTQTERS